MDKDGYPDEEELETIRTWKGDDLRGLMEYIHDLWKYADCGYWGQDPYERIFNLSTGGWSGNEDIIAAMQSNYVWWMMFWKSSERGGHYVFAPYRESNKK